MTDREKTDKPERETLHVFDLMFKFLLTEASPGAVVHFINGLFGKDYPPDGDVSFSSNESIREAQADSQKLETIRSDLILTINGDAFLIEAQIGDDETIALRVFQYGFAYAKQTMRIAEDGSEITLRMPAARILYWETTRKTPDTVKLNLIFEDGIVHSYEAATFKMLEQSLETLEQRNLTLLLPFYLLKFRKEVKRFGTTGERRKELAAEMKALLYKMETSVEHSRAQGMLSSGDAIMVMERIAQMHEELYNPYPEFEEAAMELRERLRTPLADAVRKAERESKLEGAQKERKQILELITQKHYTLEQLKETLIRESQQAAESPR